MYDPSWTVYDRKLSGRAFRYHSSIPPLSLLYPSKIQFRGVPLGLLAEKAMETTVVLPGKS